MTFKEFHKWCSERACDGRWGFITAINCINAITEINQSPFWKREKAWQKVNNEHKIVELYIEPTNIKIRQTERLERELIEFGEFFPDVKLSAIPQSVWEEVKKGISLSEAFARYKKGADNEQKESD